MILLPFFIVPILISASVDEFAHSRAELETIRRGIDGFTVKVVPFVGSSNAQRRNDECDIGTIIPKKVVATTWSSKIYLAEIVEENDSGPAAKKSRTDSPYSVTPTKRLIPGEGGSSERWVVKYNNDCWDRQQARKGGRAYEEGDSNHPLVEEYVTNKFLGDANVGPKTLFLSPFTELNPSAVGVNEESRFMSQNLVKNYEECLQLKTQVGFMVQERVGATWWAYSEHLRGQVLGKMKKVLSHMQHIRIDLSSEEEKSRFDLLVEAVKNPETKFPGVDHIIGFLQTPFYSNNDRGVSFRHHLQEAVDFLALARESGLYAIISGLEMARKTVRLVKRMHELGFVHGDMHFGNVAFRSPDLQFTEVKNVADHDMILIDFGYSVFMPDTLDLAEAEEPDKKIAGLSPLYLSPWQMQGHRRSPRDDVVRIIDSLAYALHPALQRHIRANTDREFVLKFKLEGIYFGSGSCTHLFLDPRVRNDVVKYLDSMRREFVVLATAGGPGMEPNYNNLEEKLTSLIQFLKTKRRHV